MFWAWLAATVLLLPAAIAAGVAAQWRRERTGRVDAWLHGTVIHLHDAHGHRVADLHDPRTRLSAPERTGLRVALHLPVTGARTAAELPLAAVDAGQRPDRDIRLLAAVLRRSPHQSGRRIADRLSARAPLAPGREPPRIPGPPAEPGPARSLARVGDALRGTAFAAAAVLVVLPALTAGTAAEPTRDLSGEDVAYPVVITSCEPTAYVGTHGLGRRWVCGGPVDFGGAAPVPCTFRAGAFGPADLGEHRYALASPELTGAQTAADLPGGTRYLQRHRPERDGPAQLAAAAVFWAAVAAAGLLMRPALLCWSGRWWPKRASPPGRRGPLDRP